ncbi:hypothetical protein AIGOOFII_3417 [Methylobacterium marchantiae]|nr:hypothetical protein AIGOOFII_3417 [Methylobacterium marchantiae]
MVTAMVAAAMVDTLTAVTAIVAMAIEDMPIVAADVAASGQARPSASALQVSLLVRSQQVPLAIRTTTMATVVRHMVVAVMAVPLMATVTDPAIPVNRKGRSVFTGRPFS